MGCASRDIVNNASVPIPIKQGGYELKQNLEIGSTNQSEKVSQNV